MRRSAAARPCSPIPAAAVSAYAPSRVVLLPLYPQFSTATTGSALAEWQKASRRTALAAACHAICCYPSEPGWINAIAKPLKAALHRARGGGKPRILFSAHGLPKKTVAGGDPYQWQVEASAAAVIAELGEAGLDWVVCYQSRVGPLQWIGPSIGDEIDRAGRERMAVIVVPIVFVSEHSETLVELDIDYRRRAQAVGVPLFIRLMTVGIAEDFVNGLARLVRDALARRPGLCADGGRRRCPASFARCPLEA